MPVDVWAKDECSNATQIATPSVKLRTKRIISPSLDLLTPGECVLPASTDPSYSLTIYNTAAGAHGMMVGFVWWSIAMVLAATYFIFIYRMFRGKVRVEEGATDHGY